MFDVVPNALVSVRSPESAPPPCSGYVVLTLRVVGTAPSVLYEMVVAADPLNVWPDAAPDPPLLNVTAFATLPAEPVMFALSDEVEIPYVTPLLPPMRPESVLMVSVPLMRWLPVVVAPPLIVRPVVAPPAPIVVEAVNNKPVVVALLGKRYPKFA